MAHETLAKFGYPDNLIFEYEHWSVLLRPKQVTLASLVLICNEDVTSFAEISTEAFAEKQEVVKDIEATLSALFGFDKINYLMLMMVDPHVHYHVIPRYSKNQSFEDQIFEDTGWPTLPDLAHSHEISPQAFLSLRDALRNAWPNNKATDDISATA